MSDTCRYHHIHTIANNVNLHRQQVGVHISICNFRCFSFSCDIHNNCPSYKCRELQNLPTCKPDRSLIGLTCIYPAAWRHAILHVCGVQFRHARIASGTRTCDPSPCRGLISPPHGTACAQCASSNEAGYHLTRRRCRTWIEAPAQAHAGSEYEQGSGEVEGLLQFFCPCLARCLLLVWEVWLRVD
jgi:hypothetical protein